MKGGEVGRALRIAAMFRRSLTLGDQTHIPILGLSWMQPRRSELRKIEIDPAALSPAGRGRFFDEFFAVYDAIFDGYSRDELEANFEPGEVAASRIQVMRDGGGAMVGFNAVRLYSYDLLGRRRDIFRSIAGMLPGHRGGSATIAFGLRLAAAHKLRHPSRPTYYFGSLLHPSAYRVMAKYAHVIWPRPDRRTPEDIDALISALADARGYAFDDPPSPYVRLARERTRQNDDEHEFWSNSEDPAIRFYLETNPRYSEGRGLTTLIPLTWTNLVLSTARFVSKALLQRQRIQ